MGEWVFASVYSSDGTTVKAQISFSNHLIELPVHSSRIAQARHDFPMWSASESKIVLVDGNMCLSRGPGLVYPWRYTPYVAIPQPKNTKITELSFDVFPVNSHPLSMYHKLSTQEIVFDLYLSKPPMPRLLEMLVCQYVETRFRTVDIDSNAPIGAYIDVALDNNDETRVQELLSLGDKYTLFKHAEHIMQMLFDNPCSILLSSRTEAP